MTMNLTPILYSRNAGQATPSREAEDPARAVRSTDGSEAVSNAAPGGSPVSGLSETERIRHRDYQRKWREANRERYNAYQRAYMRRRRAK